MSDLPSKKGKKGVQARALGGSHESWVLTGWLFESGQYCYLGQDTWVLEEEGLDLDRSGLNSLSGWMSVGGLPDLVKPQFHPS